MAGAIKRFEIVEYALARLLLEFFGRMPRKIAYRASALVARAGFLLAARQRRVALFNLRMAMPDLTDRKRDEIVRGVFRNLGRLLVEFSHFPQLDKSNIQDVVVYDGLDNYLEAHRRGKGILYLTGHIGAWELGSFAHSVYGHPLKFLVRTIDNPRINNMVLRYRMLGGNVPIQKNNAVRDVLKALRNNEVVGVLIDQNTTREEGIFVDFLGIPAATTTGLATLALRTGAAVVPAFLLWNEELGKHQLRFDPALKLVETGDRAKDIVENTRLFNGVLEHYVRKYPDQWLWIHRRWKTRPEGDSPIY